MVRNISNVAEIENGCWCRKLVLKSQLKKNFIYCSTNDVETECQTLMTCTLYLDLKSDLFNVVKMSFIVNIDNLDLECKCIAIL